ncbi:MAG: hypothetical protein V4598_19165 [Bdellovibrionota bacterium]
MKTIIVLSLLMSSLSAFAWPDQSNLEGVREDMCKDIKINYKTEVATCTASNAKAVLAAKVGGKVEDASYAALGFHTYGSIDLGVVVDADTNELFFYHRWLLDGAGKKVGVLLINGWENYEMRQSGRTDTRYNLKGEIVSIELKSIH